MAVEKTIATTTSSYSFAGIESRFRVVHNPHGRRMTEAEAGDFLAEHRPVGLIAGVEPLTAAVMDRCPQLQVISRCGVGLDSVDLDAARDRGIVVVNTPEAPVESVAELTVTLMLSALKAIPGADRAVRSGEWKKPRTRMLGGKTVGIVGCGRIGSRVGELLAPFGCTLLGFDPAIESHALFRLVSLAELLGESDIVSIHVPLVEATRNLIGDDELRMMKTDAILVNTARGGIINESALGDALAAGTIGGAALDVFEDEPYDGPLLHCGDRVIVTPHVAASAAESRAKMEEEAYANLVRELEPRPPVS